jgi:hypothetical protein
VEELIADRHEVSGRAAAKERGGPEANEATHNGVRKQAGNAGLGQAAPLLRTDVTGNKERLANAGRLRVRMVAKLGLDTLVSFVWGTVILSSVCFENQDYWEIEFHALKSNKAWPTESLRQSFRLAKSWRHHWKKFSLCEVYRGWTESPTAFRSWA